jgi:uncharacterized membrane protein
MYTFEHSVFIKRPPQEVFDYMTTPANTPKWQSSSESAEWISEGPVGVGSTWRAQNKFMGRKIEATLEITSWNPPNEHSFKAIGSPVPFENTVKLEDKEGGTQLILTGQAELGGFFKLAEGMVGKQLDKQMESDLANLKQMMEAGEA